MGINTLSNPSRYAMLASNIFRSDALLRLGSLRQLILGSFLVALIPLAALLWQSHNDLTKVSQLTLQETQTIAGMVTNMQRLESAGVALERTLRQYKVLESDTASALVLDAFTRFGELRRELCDPGLNLRQCARVAKDAESMQNYQQYIGSETKLDTDLNLLGQHLSELKNSVGDAIAQRIVVQQRDVSNMQARQSWFSALLVSISFALILMGTQLVINPVKKLKLIIQMLARQQDVELPPLSTTAPRDLVGVETDLHWLGERLAQLEHIRTALLRHAAHELKTPLASIKEGCSLLSEGAVGELNEDQTEVMSLLTNSTTRLNTLIEKLLDYNLLLQQAQARFSQVNVEQLVQQCIEDYQLALKRHPLSINIETQLMVADEELLRRIFDNLISNAVAHGALDKHIYIHVYAKAKRFIIDIANHGSPIAKEKIVTLFEPFVRGEGARNDNVIGTGLGLSIVADCARIMLGEVKVVEVDYAEVCFRVIIPEQD